MRVCAPSGQRKGDQDLGTRPGFPMPKQGKIENMLYLLSIIQYATFSQWHIYTAHFSLGYD